MSTTDRLRARAEELELELRQRDEKIAGLRHENDELAELLREMREQMEDVGARRDNWIEAFGLVRTEAGNYEFDKGEAVWELYGELLDKHNKLVRDWNKFVLRYNSTVKPKPPGRPLEASEAQIADVLKRRKAGASLRTIAGATSLGLSTVRTVLKGSKRASELRTREIDKQRAAAFRTRKRMRDRVPQQVADEVKDTERLIKAAKGLGR